LTSSVPQEVGRGFLGTDIFICLRDDQGKAKYAGTAEGPATGPGSMAAIKIASRIAEVLKIAKTGGRIPAPDDETLCRVVRTVTTGGTQPVPDKPYQ
jgi:hypothetical protein